MIVQIGLFNLERKGRLEPNNVQIHKRCWQREVIIHSFIFLEVMGINYSLIDRKVEHCNKLPRELVESPSFKVLKNQLVEHLSEKTLV